MTENILFVETQRFNQWWLWLILLSLGGIPAFNYYHGESWEEMSYDAKVIPIVIIVVIALFIFVIKMKTEISNESISVKYVPFITKKFLWEDLTYAQITDYGFVGGWGIRIWTSYGTVYNVRGSKGLHIKIANKQYLIGTQKEEELRARIAHLLK